MRYNKNNQFCQLRVFLPVREYYTPCEVSKKMCVSLLIKTKRQTLSGHRHILSVLILAIIIYCIIDTINFNNQAIHIV